MNNDYAQPIESLFKAFLFRPKPQRGFWRSDEGEVAERLLRGVGPKDLSFDLLESTEWGGRSFLPSMTLATQLHYVPAFMALYIADPDRVDFVEEQIVDWFTNATLILAFSHFDDPEAIVDYALPSRPLSQKQLETTPTASIPGTRLRPGPLRRMIARTETLDALHEVRKWYAEAFRPLDNPYLAVLTNAERDAFLRFFSTLEDQKPPPYGSRNGTFDRAVLAAKAMLTGDRLAKRLGAGTPDECARLVDVLDVCRRRYGALFPDSYALPIRAELERELACHRRVRIARRP